MKNLTKSLLIAAFVSIVGWLIISTAYTHTVSEEVTRIRREGRSDLIYLRTRIRELESELTSLLLEPSDPETEATNGKPATETGSQTEAVTEAVTVPTHKTPETQGSTSPSPETESPSALYLLTEHNGLIGIFDSSGNLIRTLNVFIMTLPASEQEALRVGIPAFSEDELERLAAQYE